MAYEDEDYPKSTTNMPYGEGNGSGINNNMSESFFYMGGYTQGGGCGGGGFFQHDMSSFTDHKRRFYLKNNEDDEDFLTPSSDFKNTTYHRKNPAHSMCLEDEARGCCDEPFNVN